MENKMVILCVALRSPVEKVFVSFAGRCESMSSLSGRIFPPQPDVAPPIREYLAVRTHNRDAAFLELFVFYFNADAFHLRFSP